jgi:hypothetical protein
VFFDKIERIYFLRVNSEESDTQLHHLITVVFSHTTLLRYLRKCFPVFPKIKKKNISVFFDKILRSYF